MLLTLGGLVAVPAVVGGSGLATLPGGAAIEERLVGNLLLALFLATSAFLVPGFKEVLAAGGQLDTAGEWCHTGGIGPGR